MCAAPRRLYAAAHRVANGFNAASVAAGANNDSLFSGSSDDRARTRASLCRPEACVVRMTFVDLDRPRQTPWRFIGHRRRCDGTHARALRASAPAFAQWPR